MSEITKMGRLERIENKIDKLCDYLEMALQAITDSSDDQLKKLSHNQQSIVDGQEIILDQIKKRRVMWIKKRNR